MTDKAPEPICLKEGEIYVRADLFQALEAERDALREALRDTEEALVAIIKGLQEKT